MREVAGMNCRETSKYLYAFADGELGTEENLKVLEHLNMCPDCCRQVAVQQRLKAAVRHVCGCEAAPESLRSGLADSLAREAARRRYPRLLRRARRFWRPAAIAAVLGLGIFGFWHLNSGPSGRREPVIAQVSVTDSSPLARKLAANIWGLHHVCCSEGTAHHEHSLPGDPIEAAAAMSRELGYQVLAVREIQSVGARFESARICAVTDAEGRRHRAAHMVYRGGAGEAWSLLSAVPIADMRQIKTGQAAGRVCAVLSPDDSASSAHTIVAWCGPEATYVVCAPRVPVDAVQAVEPLRVALEAHRPSAGVLAAQ